MGSPPKPTSPPWPAMRICARRSTSTPMDFLNFAVALHERTGIDIPEADYPRLHTLDGATAYLSR